MTCLACAACDGHDTPAIGLCRDCGAAACLTHASIIHTAGHPSGMGGPAQPVTRRLYCEFCATNHPGARPTTRPNVVAAQPCADPTCLC